MDSLSRPKPDVGHPESVRAAVPRHNHSSYMPALEGLRAVAAFGIMVTHVAFQTGVDQRSVFGAIAARCDFFVAVFFALSAFLLWRRYAPGCGRGRAPWRRRGRGSRARRDDGTRRGLSPRGTRARYRRGAVPPGGDPDGDGALRSYYRHRVARIAPAYLCCVIAVLMLSPAAFGAPPAAWFAQLTLTQLVIPGGLIGGLTQLWSLGVEVAFYAILPLIAAMVAAAPTRWRIGVVCVGASISSLAWPWLPIVRGQFVEGTVADPDAGVNLQIWPPSYALWFAVGIIAAELEASGGVSRAVRRLFAPRGIYWCAAVLVAWAAGQEWFGPLGLRHPSPGEFNLRILAGTLFAALLLVPYALAPKAHDALALPAWRTLGRWSYGIFLWHVAVLDLVFPLTGIQHFSGGFLPVFLLTALVSVIVAAASWEFIERPAAEWARGRAPDRR